LGPEIVVPPLVFLVCLAPLSLKELEGNRLLGWSSGVSVVPSILMLSLTVPVLFRRIRKLDELKLGAAFRIHGGDLATPEEVSPLNRADFRFSSIAPQWVCAVGLSLIGSMAWYWTDDPWLAKSGLLAAIAYLAFRHPLSNRAVSCALVISVAIGVFRLYTRDFSLVPARDGWIRAVGGAVFTVAYWWLHVGLLRLLLSLLELERRLRTAELPEFVAGASQIFQADREAFDLYEMIRRAGEESAETLRELWLLLAVGLFVCLARLPVFDAWGLSSATWLTIVLPMVLPFIVAVLLRQRAWSLRSDILRLLSRVAIDQSWGSSTGQSTAQQTTQPTGQQSPHPTAQQTEGSPAEVTAAGAKSRARTGVKSRARAGAKAAVTASPAPEPTPEVKYAAPDLRLLVEAIKTYDKGAFCPLERDPLVSAGLALVLAFFSGPYNPISKMLVGWFIF
jgi:hypothetical protein